MGSDWRDQISSIIADTNRNLGGRGLTTIAAVPPLAYCSARPAEFESVFRGGPSATAGAFSGGGGGGGGGGAGAPRLRQGLLVLADGLVHCLRVRAPVLVPRAR